MSLPSSQSVILCWYLKRGHVWNMRTLETGRFYKPGILSSLLSSPSPSPLLLLSSLCHFPSHPLYFFESQLTRMLYDIIYSTLKCRWHTPLKINIQLDDFYLCIHHYAGPDIEYHSKKMFSMLLSVKTFPHEIITIWTSVIIR